ncbi:FAD-binding oxidoreductase [Wenzhouxiangella sp. EGI_FJ10409]|uniref:FAD-binding oxidoreductase n=1 Tax=Wenzhouxiangella sp. EGI_FJ10409 TaxID=3243767 RepID=UPI0035D6B830
MRRWNGWGEASVEMALPTSAKSLLVELLGPSAPLVDAKLADVVARVPRSRLAGIDHALLEFDAETRVRHARGQSLPDWLALRSGEIGVFPDAVARPESGEQVRELLRLAVEHDFIVIPYGGGTSVAGHITPARSKRPIVTLALTKMNRLLDLDEVSGVASFGAGARGPEVEAQLRARGYTLGHFPQSWELSTLGGWVASRSSGQQSIRYGRIEQLFAGGRVETPAGPLDLPTFPASAAGPDLRELVLGSEGRLGVITEVRVRVSPLPDDEIFETLFLPDWTRAFECARELARRRIDLSMLRLANPAETFTGLRLAVDEGQLGWFERWLRLRGIGADKCMLTLGYTGDHVAVGEARRQSRAILKRYGAAAPMAGKLGRKWAHGRFRYPYLREALWKLGYAVDTFETALDWSRVDGYIRDVEARVGKALAACDDNGGANRDEPVHVFTHLSHVYRQGSSAYTSYLFRVGEDYDTTLERWRRIKAVASQAVVDWGGTISHQHGVGRDHAPYLKAEKGELGLSALATVFGRFDPDGRMNPGVLLPQDEP